ncbi:MAG TPA: toll/interleukin-1 receptor domain-containing protein [Bacteroidia bacterium]|nr:toll/interleukin-1 receptor domain-containing protein [Bacteroidia bacterium]
MALEGINRALKDQRLNKAERLFSSINNTEVPCVFISYQRDDEDYAKEVADYITSKQMDVYFDLEDNDLKKYNQANNPKAVTNAIKKGLNQSDYMLVIVSPSTYKSLWVPFEVGYAFDDKGEKMKILRHKDISKTILPSYLKVKEMLNGTISLNKFLDSVRKGRRIYENLLLKGEKIKTFSDYNSNPLNKYLDNE